MLLIFTNALVHVRAGKSITRAYSVELLARSGHPYSGYCWIGQWLLLVVGYLVQSYHGAVTILIDPCKLLTQKSISDDSGLK